MAVLGTLPRLPNIMRDLELEEDCPGLMTTPYEIRSAKDPRYNCVSFAVGDLAHYWYDAKVRGYYWPPGTPSADTLDGWLKVFSDHGYRETEDATLEPEYEKVAIYATPEAPEHAARQKASGVWTSKMGKGHDIEHPTLVALVGAIMGKVVKIMKRKCKN